MNAQTLDRLVIAVVVLLAVLLAVLSGDHYGLWNLRG